MLKDIALRSGIRCWKLMQMQLGCVAGLWLEITSTYTVFPCFSSVQSGQQLSTQSPARGWGWRHDGCQTSFSFDGKAGLESASINVLPTRLDTLNTHTLLYTLSSFNQNPGSRPIASASLFLEFVQYPPPTVSAPRVQRSHFVPKQSVQICSNNFRCCGLKDLATVKGSCRWSSCCFSILLVICLPSYPRTILAVSSWQHHDSITTSSQYHNNMGTTPSSSSLSS